MLTPSSRWLKFLAGTLFSTSPMDLATFLASRNMFLRSISQTQKAFLKAAGHGLPEASPYSLVPEADPDEAVTIRLRGDTGLPHSTLVPMLELLRLSGARRVLEIGTQYGKTTWHLAANLPQDGHLWTVDLPQVSDRKMSGRETQPGEQVRRVLSRYARGKADHPGAEELARTFVRGFPRRFRLYFC